MGFELPFVIGPEYIAVALFGVVIGIIFGAIPGMTATMAVAVFLPLTYAYSMEMALYLLLGLYVGGISGGLVPAILINIPGTPSSVCTTFDGHPMALRGEGERALKIGVTSSFMGGMISLVVLASSLPSWPAGPSSSPPWRSSSSSSSPSPSSPPCPGARCSAACGSVCWACW